MSFKINPNLLKEEITFCKPDTECKPLDLATLEATKKMVLSLAEKSYYAAKITAEFLGFYGTYRPSSVESMIIDYESRQSVKITSLEGDLNQQRVDFLVSATSFLYFINGAQKVLIEQLGFEHLQRCLTYKEHYFRNQSTTYIDALKTILLNSIYFTDMVEQARCRYASQDPYIGKFIAQVQSPQADVHCFKTAKNYLLDCLEDLKNLSNKSLNQQLSLWAGEEIREEDKVGRHELEEFQNKLIDHLVRAKSPYTTLQLPFFTNLFFAELSGDSVSKTFRRWVTFTTSNSPNSNLNFNNLNRVFNNELRRNRI